LGASQHEQEECWEKEEKAKPVIALHVSHNGTSCATFWPKSLLCRDGTRELPLTVIQITFDFKEGDDVLAIVSVPGRVRPYRRRQALAGLRCRKAKNCSVGAVIHEVEEK